MNDTYRDNLLHRLEEDEELTSEMLKHFAAAVAIIDSEGIVLFESSSVANIIGYNDTLGTSILERAHPSARSLIRQKISDCARLGGIDQHIEYMVAHRDGGWRHVEVFMHNMLVVPSINGILLHIRDRTEYDRIRKRAFYFEFNDSITGLPKRDLFMSRLQRKVNRAAHRDNTIAVMSLGLNRFQNINDMYGPTTGYYVLKKIGQRLRDTFREDDLVCRFDGSVFMVLLADIHDSQNVRLIFRKAEEALVEPLRIKNDALNLTAGMGICFYPQDGKDADTLIRNSMAAMNNAMNNGMTAYALFDEKQNREMLRRIEIGNELIEALKKNEFQVLYQPKVDRFKKIAGMEALVRWNSPSRGAVLPTLFVPIAEKNGIIGDIDKIVLRTVCSQVESWIRCGSIAVPVSVNISARELNGGALAADIKQILVASKIEPQWLEIEITESALMKNQDDGIRNLTEIHEMGVRVAIDDFGTGYSSLSRLKDYPVDTLKIDQSFVRNIPRSQKSAILIKTIITLAHDLGFQVVAEGVENQRQFDFLIEKGCDFFQGYFFCKPKDAFYFEDSERIKAYYWNMAE